MPTAILICRKGSIVLTKEFPISKKNFHASIGYIAGYAQAKIDRGFSVEFQ